MCVCVQGETCSGLGGKSLAGCVTEARVFWGGGVSFYEADFYRLRCLRCVLPEAYITIYVAAEFPLPSDDSSQV